MLTAALVAGGLSVLAFTATCADQPQWGQAWSRNMVSSERGLPDAFDPETGRNIKWSVQLGTETHSSPVVAGGRVYIGTNNGNPRDANIQGDHGILLCLAEDSGRLLWQLAVPKREQPYDWPQSGICSPVTVEGNRVYLVSNRGEVVCLNAAGKEGKADFIWSFDLTSGAGVCSHDAAHSSILINGDYLYLNTGTGVDSTHKRMLAPDAPSLLVLDKSTGRFVARDQEHIAANIFHCTWSAPSLGEVNGRPLLFFAAGNGIVYAFQTLSGQDRLPPSPSPMPVPIRSGAEERAGERRPDKTMRPEGGNAEELGPATAGGAAAAQRAAVKQLKCVWRFDFDPAAPKANVLQFNRNRRESPSNFYGMPVFYQDRLFVAGGGDLWWGKNEAWLKCLAATGSGDITTNGLIWSYPLRKHVFSTPAVFNGLVFIADCGGCLHCIDARSGAPCWAHEIEGEAWASPLVADNKVYLGTRRGFFYILAANREKRLLQSLDLRQPISSTTVAANGVVYLATMNRLYALANN